MRITAAYKVFLKKLQNDIISPKFMLQVICFSLSTKITVLVELTTSEFPCQTSFPDKHDLQIFPLK